MDTRLSPKVGEPVGLYQALEIAEGARDLRPALLSRHCGDKLCEALGMVTRFIFFE